IVWGDIALIDGNINAQGSDIAKTGGFVETSGHDLSIGDNAIVDAKEWLLDPDEVTIGAASPGRNEDISENAEYPTGTGGSASTAKTNNPSKNTLTNSTLEKMLKRGLFVNITAERKINVTSSINLSNGSLTLYTKSNGLELNGDITSSNNGANLTIHSGGWLDIHSNISLGVNDNINITAKKDIAFEKGNNQVITGQGVITSGDQKGFRFENVSLNGIGTGLLFNISRPRSNNGNITNFFNGTLNISGTVNISMVAPDTDTWYNRHKGRTHWNLSHLNVSQNSKFTLAIDSRGSPGSGAGQLQPYYDLNGISFTKDTTFNVSKGAKVDFNINTAIGIIGRNDNLNYALFNGNISVLGGGAVNFDFVSSTSNVQTPGVIIESKYFNVSEGSNLTFKTQGSTKTGFLIKNDFTLNATGGNISLLQVEGTDGQIGKGVVANKNITFEGGNITFGSKKAITEIKGNVTINQNANVTLLSSNYDQHKSPLNITGNVTNKGNLTATGSVINIAGNLTVETNAEFLANPNFSFNVSGLFNNKGNSNISIAKGGARFKDIDNSKNLSVTTNSNSTYRTIISGNITNKKGDLNITDNKTDAEIQIGGNISQKEGNLTIFSDKVNITKQITIKAGVDEEGSDPGTESNANLTIKTKELKLVKDLNISGFNKAEITAKEGADLIIGNSDNNNNANAKKVTFNQVKDSKISAGDYNVTLNSEVETSNGGSNAGNDNSTGLTISAKDVAVNNNITSHKTVNITASENVTTKVGTTINATTGSVEVTAKTGDIKGGIESNSGNVNITASGNTLEVSNITGQNVTVTATSGAVTTTEGSTINATTGNASITTQIGNINGKVESSSGSVTLVATGETLAVSNISGGTVTITADSGKLTTTKDSTINATTNSVDISVKEGNLQGAVEAKGDSVNITAKESNLTVSNVTAKNNVTVKAEQGILTTTSGGTIKSEESKVELTAQSGSIIGNVVAEKDSVTVTASAGKLSVANITGKTATLTAESGKLTTQAGSTISGTESVTTSSQSGDISGTISGNIVSVTATDSLTTQASSSITSNNGQTTLTAKDSSIAGSINAANVTLNTTGTLTTVAGSKIKAASGTLVINAKDAQLDGAASGDHTVVNATNANGSGSVIATTSSRVNITGDLITINGLNIISRNGINTVVLKGVEIDV
ncbi:adhesin, partial [Haemophilus influenzae]